MRCAYLNKRKGLPNNLVQSLPVETCVVLCCVVRARDSGPSAQVSHSSISLSDRKANSEILLTNLVDSR